jgi:phosphatidylinositol 4-kinase
MGYVRQLLLRITAKSQLIAHQLLWNMKTNIFRDEEGEHYDEEIGESLENLMEQIRKSMSPQAVRIYNTEFDFFFQITDVSRIIKPYPKVSLYAFCACVCVCVCVFVCRFLDNSEESQCIRNKPK